MSFFLHFHPDADDQNKTTLKNQVSPSPPTATIVKGIEIRHEAFNRHKPPCFLCHLLFIVQVHFATEYRDVYAVAFSDQHMKADASAITSCDPVSQ